MLEMKKLQRENRIYNSLNKVHTYIYQSMILSINSAYQQSFQGTAPMNTRVYLYFINTCFQIAFA